ncbi:unnamed protein product [marine sediment metagenome]|uniref:DUF998 domain-containing protein n=1 Tax=marine sediment metagenome TaxID=412755 RepID=X1APR8_9ZZZZ
MSKTISKFYEKVPGFIWGYIGVGIPVLAMFITALIYTDPLGAPFSIFNMFVSELGERAVSQTAWLFNWGLILAGIPLILFMLGLGLKYKSIPGLICTAGGLFCSISAFFVGVFPMDYGSELYMTGHIVSAMSFFYGGMATIFLFSILIFVDKKKVLPKWLGVFGLLVAVVFALFIFLPEGALDDIMVRPRDNFLLIAFLEWLVVFAIFSWILTTSVILNFQSRKKIKQESTE